MSGNGSKPVEDGSGIIAVEGASVLSSLSDIKAHLEGYGSDAAPLMK